MKRLSRVGRGPPVGYSIYPRLFSPPAPGERLGGLVKAILNFTNPPQIAPARGEIVSNVSRAYAVTFGRPDVETPAYQLASAGGPGKGIAPYAMARTFKHGPQGC